MKHFRVISLLFLLIPLFAKAQQTPDFSWLDHHLPAEERAARLIGTMSPEEKMSQLLHQSPAIPRLEISAYNWWNECLHGVGRAGLASVFPQAIGMAATFDPDLLYRVATAISDEARAKHHQALKQNQHGAYQGLTFWSPNINLFRDPRWGRGMETYGEDPYLSGKMATAFIQGLQGDHPQYLKLIATAKHFAVHSGPEATRHSFNVEVNEFDLFNSYLPHFKTSIEKGKVESIMCAYNRLHNEPCCGSDPLLKEILRKQWNFDGYIVSDCWAISDFHQFHKITPDVISSAVKALQSGTDLNCGSSYKALPTALKLELIREAEIDSSLLRLFTARFRLGMFDPPNLIPFANFEMSRVDTSIHRELALETAQKSIVLLKNDKDLLPINSTYKTIAVIGPNADAAESLLGNYHGTPAIQITPLDGIRTLCPNDTKILFTQGCRFAEQFPEFCNTPSDLTEDESLWGISPEEKALELARQSDLVLFFGGLSPMLEGEALQLNIDGFSGGDRTRLELPQTQVNLLKDLYKTGKPIVLILMSGSAISIPWEKENLPAILQAWYPGQAGGTAIAEVLFGKINPGGKLPFTIYASHTDLPDFEDYSMKGRTYKYFEKEALYEFGFGLSYTQFALTKLNISRSKFMPGDTLEVNFQLKNTGTRAGDEVVQLYINFPDEPDKPGWHHSEPELKDFRRILLQAGEELNGKFRLSSESFSRLSPEGEYIPKGEYRIYLSTSSKTASDHFLITIE